MSVMEAPKDFALGKWLRIKSRKEGIRYVLDFGVFNMRRPEDIRRLAKYLNDWADWKEEES